MSHSFFSTELVGGAPRAVEMKGKVGVHCIFIDPHNVRNQARGFIKILDRWAKGVYTWAG